MTEHLVSAESLHLRYGVTAALTNANIEVDSGEVVALVGASGSGKTSLLYCLAGLLRPAQGVVRYGDTCLSDLGYDDLASLRREHFGFVFQFAELVAELNLEENIALPLELNHFTTASRKERVAELLERFGLVEAAKKRPAQVSGGEAQRTAVARALAHHPRLIFADEPTGSLDPRNCEVVLDSLLVMAREEGAAVVLVTHDEQIAQHADRSVRMAAGAVVQS